MRQNTQAIQAQTRDSITEKQMEYMGWLATDVSVAGLFQRGISGGFQALSEDERMMFEFLINGMLREFENSHYQFERGLFTPSEFEARLVRWNRTMSYSGSAVREVWARNRETSSPSFRAEIDRIVAEVEQAR
jgi:hypothetical protein